MSGVRTCCYRSEDDALGCPVCKPHMPWAHAPTLGLGTSATEPGTLSATAVGALLGAGLMMILAPGMRRVIEENEKKAKEVDVDENGKHHINPIEELPHIASKLVAERTRVARLESDLHFARRTVELLTKEYVEVRGRACQALGVLTVGPASLDIDSLVQIARRSEIPAPQNDE